jgi:replicative DNA helicase
MSDDFIETQDVIKNLFEKAEKNQNNCTPHYTIESGITELDGVLHGFKGGDLNIIASRPGIGKTMLSLYMCSCMSVKGIKSLYISFEENELDILKNILAIQTHLDITLISEDRIKSSDIALLFEAANAIYNCGSLFLKSFYNTNIITLKEFIKNAIETHKIQIVFIDYLSLIIPAPSYTNRWEQVSEVSRSLKTTAMEYKIPLIVLCPLNRNAVDNLPQISDLSESGSIEYDSDRIILLYEENKKDYSYEEKRRELKYEQKNLVTIAIAKNRRGALHKFDMIFDYRNKNIYDPNIDIDKC